jgi:hypothetical protein
MYIYIYIYIHLYAYIHIQIDTYKVTITNYEKICRTNADVGIHDVHTYVLCIYV